MLEVLYNGETRAAVIRSLPPELLARMLVLELAEGRLAHHGRPHEVTDALTDWLRAARDSLGCHLRLLTLLRIGSGPQIRRLLARGSLSNLSRVGLFPARLDGGVEL